MAITLNSRDIAIAGTVPRTTTYTGYNSVTLVLLTPITVVSADSSGAVLSLPSGNAARLYLGGTQVTSNVSYSVAVPAYNGLSCTIHPTTGAISIAQTAIWSPASTQEVFTIIATYNGVVYTVLYTVTKTLAGTPGAGSNAFSAVLTNENASVPCTSAGTPVTYAGVVTTLNIYDGASPATGYAVSVAKSTGVICAEGTSSFTQTVTGVTTDISYIDFTATKLTFPTLYKRFLITKSYAGAVGTSPTAYWLNTSTAVLAKSITNVFLPANVILTAMSVTGSASPVAYSGRYKVYENGTLMYTSAAAEASYTRTPSGSGVTSIKAELYLASDSGYAGPILDVQTIPVVQDGATGLGGAAFQATVYNQSNITIAPSGGTYNFNTGVLTPPSGWSVSSFTSSLIPIYACHFIFRSTTGTDTITAGTWTTPYITSVGTTKQATAYLYQWGTATQPSNPSSTSSWTWSSGAHTGYAGAAGWLLDPGTNPNLPGGRLWVATKYVIADPTETSTPINWSIGTVTIYAASANGTPGTKAFIPTVFKWASSIPTIAGTGLYTWSNGDLGTLPITGWTASPGTGASGQSLWGASVQIVDSTGATTTNIPWGSASITVRGYQGLNGTGSRNLFIVAPSQVFQISKTGSPTPASIVFTANSQGLADTPTFFTSGGTATLTSVTGSSATLAYADFLSDSVTVQVNQDGLSDYVTIVKVREGSDAVNIVLSNQAHTLPAGPTGGATAFTGAETFLTILRGAADDTANWSISYVDNSLTSIRSTTQGGGASGTGRWWRVTSQSADLGTIAITATNGGTTLLATFSCQLARSGAPGSSVTGPTGISARRAYTLTTASSLGSGTVTVGTGTGYLPGSSTVFGSGLTWTSTPSTPAAGQTLYQSDGLYNPSTDLVVFETPYISALKVGNLSAIQVNTGGLTINGTLLVESGDIRSNNYSPGTAGYIFTPTTAQLPAASIIGTLSIGNAAPGTVNADLNAAIATAGSTSTWAGVSGTGKPSDYATADISLVPRGTGLVVTGNKVTANVVTGWGADCYSRESFTGGAYVSVTVGQNNCAIMFGLNVDPTLDSSYTSIDHAIYVTSGANVYIFQDGGSSGIDYGPYAANDRFSVLYDGSTIYYYKNDVVLTSVAKSPGIVYYFDSSFADVGFIYNVRFGPLTSNNWASIGGTNKPQDNATYNQSDAIVNSALAARLRTDAASTLSAPITLASAGAIQTGADANNSVVMSPSGIVGKYLGNTMFAINASTGAATFAGILTASQVVTTDNLQDNAASLFNMNRVPGQQPIPSTATPVTMVTVGWGGASRAGAELLISCSGTVKITGAGGSSGGSIRFAMRLVDQYASTLAEHTVLTLYSGSSLSVSGEYNLSAPDVAITTFGPLARSTWWQGVWYLTGGFSFATVSVTNATIIIRERKK